jgi:hypothetical protein
MNRSVVQSVSRQSVVMVPSFCRSVVPPTIRRPITATPIQRPKPASMSGVLQVTVWSRSAQHGALAPFTPRNP